MKELRGGCHCGNITYTLQWPTDDAPPYRKCQCSFCTKHNPTYTGHPGAALTVTVKNLDAIARYRFGTQTADFCFCSRCGAMPFVSSRIDGRDYAVINANTLEGIDVPKDVEVRNFESETRDDRLGRRQRSWIPELTITTA